MSSKVETPVPVQVAALAGLFREFTGQALHWRKGIQETAWHASTAFLAIFFAYGTAIAAAFSSGDPVRLYGSLMIAAVLASGQIVTGWVGWYLLRSMRHIAHHYEDQAEAVGEQLAMLGRTSVTLKRNGTAPTWTVAARRSPLPASS